MADFFQLLLQVLSILNIIFAIVIVFSERKNPAVTWAWLMVIAVVPYIGFIIYMMIGRDSRKHRVFLEKSRMDDQLNKEYLNMDINSAQFITKQSKYLSQKNIMHMKGTEHLNDLVKLNMISGGSAFTTNNKLELFHEGNSKFEAMLNDIGKAKTFIHIQYYIVRNDELGREVIAALAKKAAAGVEVRLLIDGMGCMQTPKKFYQPLIEAGGCLGIFMPPHFIRINFRNHRKLCIIDGNIGYIGGLNIGTEYLGLVKKFGYWRDSHIRIDGDAVKNMELRFLMDWNFCSAEKIKLSDRYFPENKISPEKGVLMQIVSSGPDTKWPSIHYGYTKMITEADKSIYIETPYFVPDDSIFEALRIAALSGIDVRIVIPAHPDHPFVYWAGLSYMGELLEAGVKCYKYERGFIHSKLIMIDSLLCSIGTANMDVRSFKLNFEVNSFIYDEKITRAFENQFKKDLSDCTEITPEWYSKRSGSTKLKESISRLLSPLL